MGEISLWEKLLKIQQELNAPKNQRNEFGKYNYRSCEDILQAVKPLLLETKTVLIVTDEIVGIGGRIYVKAEAALKDTESPDSISTIAYAREEENKKGMDASQVTGAASSYARKYALNGLFAIDDSRDSDATNDHGAPQQTQAPRNARPQQQGHNNPPPQQWAPQGAVMPPPPGYPAR